MDTRGKLVIFAKQYQNLLFKEYNEKDTQTKVFLSKKAKLYSEIICALDIDLNFKFPGFSSFATCYYNDFMQIQSNIPRFGPNYNYLLNFFAFDFTNDEVNKFICDYLDSILSNKMTKGKSTKMDEIYFKKHYIDIVNRWISNPHKYQIDKNKFIKTCIGYERELNTFSELINFLNNARVFF